ncbi:MAG TPA: Calx-beta domain-containing protein [Anaerolineales bacterium]|nr:Calx-beta domain-containing protein [Anaerolineales bacterium]
MSHKLSLTHLFIILALCAGLLGPAQPAAAQPQPAAARSQPAAARSQPAAARSQPAAAQPTVIEVANQPVPEADYEFVVNISDPMAPDTYPGDLLCWTATGKCSLYAAIQEANAMPGSVRITFAPEVTEIVFTEDDCCLPPIGRTSPTAAGFTTIYGANAVALVGAGTGVIGQSQIGLALVGQRTYVYGLELRNWETAVYIQGDNNILGADGYPDEYQAYERNHIYDNSVGVEISGDENYIGGNTISGSLKYGLRIYEGANNNTVGVNTGTYVPSYTRNIIDGGERCLIVDGNENTIAGNSISFCDPYGVSVGGDGNTIGVNGNEFNDPYEGNQVSDNVSVGIIVFGDENVVAGNYSGLYEDGSLRPNLNGISIAGDRNHVGPNGDGISDDLEVNYFSGNRQYGIYIDGNDNVVVGNVVGLAPDGSPLQNDKEGLSISGSDNVVGGVEPWQANTITRNGRDGIALRTYGSPVTGNTLRGNHIYQNLGLEIDLADTGRDTNDPGDVDTGENDRQNYPLLTAALRVSGGTHLLGSFNSTPLSSFTLDFYHSAACSGNTGEAEAYLGALNLATDADGNASIDVILPVVEEGRYLSALATNSAGSTSEFSDCKMVTLAPVDGAMEVNSTADEVDSDLDDSTCDTGNTVGGEPECTLRAAIQQANRSPGHDLVILPAGTYTLTRPGFGENDAVLGDLDITGDLTIYGASPALTVVDGGGVDRVFEVRSTAAVTMTNISLQGGGMMSNGRALLNGGSLLLSQVAVRFNLDGGSGTVYNSGSLSIVESSFYSNTVSFSGGGLYNAGDAALTNVTFSGNQAGMDGGAIFVAGGTLTINNTTFTLNAADADGDGVGEGGALFNDDGVVHVANSLIAQNLDLGDDEQDGSDAWDCAGAFISDGYNMLSDKAFCTGFGSATYDLVGGIQMPFGGGYLTFNAALAPLADNGGPTLTHMPRPSINPYAVDGGSPETPGSSAAACAATDQRGTARPQDGDGDLEARCDRGAVEYSMPTLWFDHPVVTEGETAVFTITLQPASSIAVTVAYTTTDSDGPDTATSGADYTPLDGVLTFAPGETVKTVGVQTLTDTLFEGDEVFYLELGGPQNAVLGHEKGVAVIQESGAQPTLSIAGGGSVAEGNSGTKQVAFTLNLSGPSSLPVEVSFASRDGSANSSDYVPLVGLVTIDPGVTTYVINVEVRGDTLVEADETFYLDLSNVFGATLATSSALVTILNDDQPEPPKYYTALPIVLR